jgi:hypothetical protein
LRGSSVVVFDFPGNQQAGSSRNDHDQLFTIEAVAQQPRETLRIAGRIDDVNS